MHLKLEKRTRSRVDVNLKNQMLPDHVGDKLSGASKQSKPSYERSEKQFAEWLEQGNKEKTEVNLLSYFSELIDSKSLKLARKLKFQPNSCRHNGWISFEGRAFKAKEIMCGNCGIISTISDEMTSFPKRRASSESFKSCRPLGIMFSE